MAISGKVRPMTTKLGDRRFTFQPETISSAINPLLQAQQSDMDGVYERYGSPQKTKMQLFEEQQRLTCARLSVPNSRRRRERFDGTQNTFMFQTVQAPAQAYDAPGAVSVADEQRRSVFHARSNSGGSIGENTLRATASRVKSSLMGTTARQKLLSYKLAAKQGDAQHAEQAKIKDQISELVSVGAAEDTVDRLHMRKA